MSLPAERARVRAPVDLSSLTEFLNRRVSEWYFVGGYVRDRLLGRETHNFDVVVGGGALALAREYAGLVGGSFVPLDEQRQVARVVLPYHEGSPRDQVDFAAMRGSLTQDLKTRDFTIDAMALSGSGSLLDPLGGQEDLRAGRVRAASERVFADDPVRLLRAARIAAQLGFRVEAGTEALVLRDRALLARTAPERAQEELWAVLVLPGAGDALRALDRLGLLTTVFPELEPARAVEQPKEHRWDVLTHSLAAVDAAALLLRELPPEALADRFPVWAAEAVPWLPESWEHERGPIAAGHSRATLLKLAALLHDVAKPQTRSLEADGRIHFFGHAQQGAEIAANALKRLRFSAREVKAVRTMVRHHLRPGMLGEPPTRRAVFRYFRDTEEEGIDIIYLGLADHLATRGPLLAREDWWEHSALALFLLERRFREPEVVRPPKLVDGEDVMRLLGVGPGPRVGVLLAAVREAQGAGEVTTREEAIALLERLFGKGC